MRCWLVTSLLHGHGLFFNKRPWVSFFERKTPYRLRRVILSFFTIIATLRKIDITFQNEDDLDNLPSAPLLTGDPSGVWC